jgi:polyhydroxybutyrate depolymerase
LVLLAALLAVACTAGPDRSGLEPGAAPNAASPTSSAGCSAPPAEPGVTDRTISSGGVERRYELTVPPAYDGSTPFAVVLALHALTVPHTASAFLAGFADMAPHYDFIGVAPSGRMDGDTPYWLAAPVDDNADVAFVAELLDELERDLCIDPSRVYATGASNGGQMSSLLACRLGDRIAAVAPVAGVEFSESCAGPPVPVMAFFGSADQVVTYDGGGLNAARIGELHHWKGPRPEGLPEHEGVDAAMAAWSAHNGCEDDVVEERISSEVLRRTWQDCDAETVLYLVEDGGHTWPGKPSAGYESVVGHTTTDIDASTLMFEFFFSQSRARPEG